MTPQRCSYRARPSAPHRTPCWAPRLAAGLALLPLACGGSPPSPTAVEGDGGAVPLDGEGTSAFFVDPHFAGKASRLKIEEIRWGRLADVYEVRANGERVLRHPSFLIAADLESDEDLTIEETPLTQRTAVLVHHSLGSAEYTAAIRRMTEGLGTVGAFSGDVEELVEYPVVPRNAALSVRFSDLLDVSSIAPDTVRVLAGIPATQPLSVRLFADPNHGGVRAGADGEEDFHPTRVLIDPTISTIDLIAEEAAGNAGQFLPNGVGFPESTSENQPNLRLQFATREDASVAQFRVVRNLAGRGLDEAGNGPVDADLPSLPIVRAFRSGGRTGVTGDAWNGFLSDLSAPRVIGSQRVRLTGAEPAQKAGEFLIEYDFEIDACALAPRIGDLLELPGALAEFTREGTLEGDLVRGARVRSFGGGDLTKLVGLDALHATPYDPTAEHLPECFVTLRPTPKEFPLRGVDPRTEITLRFTEPMDPVALNGLEGLVLTRTAGDPGPMDIVVSSVQQAPDLHTFTLRPRLPLSHVNGERETYTLRMDLAQNAPGDLAGIPLADPLPNLTLELDADAPTDRTGGYVLRFDSVDEDGNGRAELRGQYFPQEGRIVPRPVQRYSVQADRHRPTVQQMQILPHPIFSSPYDNGVTEPLTPFGSRLMTTWRYADLGLGLQDESSFNIDVEGIAWRPRAGSLVADVYPDFEMRLSHSSRVPDEGADLPTASIWTPGSGLLSTTFDQNVLDDENNEPAVVHERAEGYFIDPLQKFVSDNGDLMMPFPMNLGKDANNRRTYTWRDTAILATGGEDSLGVPIGGQVNSGELASPVEVGAVAPAPFVPSIGLPLLIDLHTWPNNSGGHNQFDAVLAGFPTTFGFDLPANFRVHSTGGVDNLGEIHKVDPSTAEQPSGGFNTVAAIAPPGTPTTAADSLFYKGQLDIVVRISRAYSIWIDAGGAAEWTEPVTVPAPEQQPHGTGVDFDFRGALAVLGAPATDAFSLDAYGDQPVSGTAATIYRDPAEKNYAISFADSDDRLWQSEEEAITGSRWFQTRLTFENNISSNESPELHAVGFAFDILDGED